MTIAEFSPDSTFQVAKLLCDKGDFKEALKKLNASLVGFRSSKDWSGYLKTQNLRLRVFVEMEEYDEVNGIKEDLQDLVIRENVELTAKTYYTLALCASFKKQYSLAMEYLEKSLAIALTKDAKEDICYAVNGLALVYFALGKYDEALKEIYNLQVFYQVLEIPDLKISSQILNGHILRKKGEFDKALEVYWQCYDQLKQQKNMYMYLSLLHALGLTYKEMGDLNMARVYLDLASRAIDPTNHKHLYRLVNEKLESIGAGDKTQYDIVFKAASNAILEKKKGAIDFKNQFILMDMLRLFLKNPGEVYSKEELVKKVWKQNYDPMVHDNKIYVTIKRLRKMIEPDFDRPKYIFRAKNGYYLNKSTSVLFEQ